MYVSIGIRVLRSSNRKKYWRKYLRFGLTIQPRARKIHTGCKWFWCTRVVGRKSYCHQIVEILAKIFTIRTDSTHHHAYPRIKILCMRSGTGVLRSSSRRNISENVLVSGWLVPPVRMHAFCMRGIHENTSTLCVLLC